MQPPAAAPHLGAAALANGVTEVGQLTMNRIAANTYYLTATVRRSGGAGGWDAMSGIWDEAARTFVKNNDVDHLNGPADEFSCTVSPDLLTVALDTPSGAKFAVRIAPTGAFGPANNIVGAPAGYIDPVLCDVQGLLNLAFIQGNDLMLANFSDGALSHARVLIPAFGRPLHSPSVIVDEAGEARAVAFAQNENGTRSTAWTNASVRATATASASFKLIDRPSWLANPAAVGGTLRFAESNGRYDDPLEVGVLLAHATCISTSGGPENLDLRAFAPVQTAAAAMPYVGLFLLGNLATAPIPIPGLQGSPLGLDPGSMVTLPFGMFDKTTGVMRLTLATPPLPPVRMHVTPVAIDHNRQPLRVFLGNSAPMVAEDTRWCGKDIQQLNGNACPVGYVKVRHFRVGVEGTLRGRIENYDPYCIKCNLLDTMCLPNKICLLIRYRSRTYMENGTRWAEFRYDCACQ